MHGVGAGGGRGAAGQRGGAQRGEAHGPGVEGHFGDEVAPLEVQEREQDPGLVVEGVEVFGRDGVVEAVWSVEVFVFDVRDEVGGEDSVDGIVH